MHVIYAERVELAAYQLKGVARVWYDQWKKSRVEGATDLVKTTTRGKDMGLPSPCEGHVEVAYILVKGQQEPSQAVVPLTGMANTRVNARRNEEGNEEQEVPLQAPPQAPP
ncbi:hypothetical protein MTR67_002843 [Solanum verrucosum]|uniref:Uncharacterized protein n=1 Tax=Solanum verrucosum TaxID=315347 RepID=A0AAF0T9U2_SOLVR|nr:hypothetical protein MTR67_002843 [Solanum verrucosum]